MERAVLMIGVALFFDLLKFLFSLLFLFAPLIIGTAAGLLTAAKCADIVDFAWLCHQLGYAVGTVAGVATAAAEIFTGVGAAAIGAVGEVFADMLGFSAALVFFIWYLLAGIKLFGTKRASIRFFITMTGTVANLVPFINLGPWTTASVSAVVWQAVKEDAEEKRKEKIKKARELRTPFSAADSLRSVRQSPRETRMEGLRGLKKKFVSQQEGLATVQARMAEQLQKNPDMTGEEIYEQFVHEGEKFGINETQKAAARGIAERYEKRRDSIRELRNAYGDDRELYKVLFGRYPNGRVQIIPGPASLYVRAFDPSDYARIYRNDGGHGLHETDTEASAKSGGVSLDRSWRVPELAGAITAENASRYGDAASERVRSHEEQHAIKKLFGDKLRNDSTIASAEERARDEILAYATDGTSPAQIVRTLTTPKENGGLYDYLHPQRQWGKENGYSEDVVETVYGIGPDSDHGKKVVAGVDALATLMTNGYSLEEAKALLIHEPLHRWPKVADRIERAPSPKIEGYRQEQRRISRREALAQVGGAALRGAALGTAGVALNTLVGDTETRPPRPTWRNPDYIDVDESPPEGAG